MCSCRCQTRGSWLQDGMKGVEQQYRSSEEYHEAWKMKARDLLAKSEFRKRKITMRVSVAAAGPVRLPLDHAWPSRRLRNVSPPMVWSTPCVIGARCQSWSLCEASLAAAVERGNGARGG